MPSVTLSETMAWEGHRDFEVRACHAEECEDYAVREPERGTDCSRRNLATLCVRRSVSALTFEATWSVHSTPSQHGFRLRIENRENGEVLLDEERETNVQALTTEPGECARCDRVTIDLSRD